MDRYSEVERKFDADPGALLPDLSGAAAAVSEAVEAQLDATYFDTADTRLARHHVPLRRRTGGDDAGWHLKLPSGLDERTEVRLPLGRATRKVPVALAREVRALVRDRPLVPIAVLHTTRIERRLLDGDGNTLATIADDTVHGPRLADGAVQESTWREVGVELEARACPWRQRGSDTGSRPRGDEQRWEGHGWCGGTRPPAGTGGQAGHARSRRPGGRTRRGAPDAGGDPPAAQRPGDLPTAAGSGADRPGTAGAQKDPKSV